MENWTSAKKWGRLPRLAVLLGVGGLLSTWASSVDFASPPALVVREREDARAVQILQRALIGSEHNFFSGEQTILNFDTGDGSACVTQETHLGPNRFRIVYQNPPDARGRLQIADGTWFQHYLPQTNTLIQRRITPLSVAETNTPARLQHIRQNYRLNLAAQTDNLAGRAAYVLDIMPRIPDRPHQKLWIDTETGLVLRRETYNPAGIQTSVTSWRDLHFYTAPPEAALSWSPPEGTRTLKEEGEAILPLAEARANADPWAVVPEKLGGSFYFESAYLANTRGGRCLHCTYSDGICTLSLMQLAGTQSFQTTSGTIDPMPIASYNAESAQITTRGSVNILSWSNPHRGATLSLLGELTDDALITMAQSLP
ncbi:MAG TPA: sigma-E factor regulatory protein RseB domain-containing protein [Chthonomonadaceae bacterium]|nr:sigma-E factor regulatory protein RseB domain-containing protein [Chthonomonadaceae bacterium]